MSFRTFVLATAITAIGPALAFTASSAAAAPPEYPHGVGVCFSQLAIDPSLDGVGNLGEAVVTKSTPGVPGSDVPTALDGVRGDGAEGGCGAPPGPGHLG